MDINYDVTVYFRSEITTKKRRKDGTSDVFESNILAMVLRITTTFTPNIICFTNALDTTSLATSGKLQNGIEYWIIVHSIGPAGIESKIRSRFDAVSSLIARIMSAAKVLLDGGALRQVTPIDGYLVRQKATAFSLTGVMSRRLSVCLSVRQLVCDEMNWSC